MKSVTVFVKGKVYWAKIVGDKALVDNYDKDGKEWTYEFEPEDTSFLKTHRLLDRLKDKNATGDREGKEYLILKKPELDRDGKKNAPINIVDEDGNDWNGKLLGNGTAVDAKLSIVDFGAGKKKAIWTLALRVRDLVEYEGGGGDAKDFSGMDDKPSATTKAAPAKPTKKPVALDDLDDSIDDFPPF